MSKNYKHFQYGNEIFCKITDALKKMSTKLDKYVLKLRKILYFLVFTPLFDLKSKCKIKSEPS